jgi:hypothetical protein
MLQAPQQIPRRHSLWLYTALWLFYVYLYVQILEFDQQNSSNLLLSGLYFIEFGVHEMSHVITAFLPPIFTAAAGSIGEMGFTALIAYAGFKAKSYFAGIFGLLWLTLAMNSAGRYMADARAQQLQLVGFGPDPQHDWHFVFSKLGWLSADTAIGTVVRAIGDLLGAGGLLLGLGLIIWYAIHRPSNRK